MGHNKVIAEHRRFIMLKLLNPDTYKETNTFQFTDVTGEKIEVPCNWVYSENGYYTFNSIASYMHGSERQNRARLRMMRSIKMNGYEILEHSIDKHGVVRSKHESEKLTKDIERWNTAYRYNVKARMLHAGLVNIINGKIAYQAQRNMEEAIIPEMIETMPLADNLRVFRVDGCIKSVKIYANITHIASSMFASCSSLSQILFPKNLKEIGAMAFYACNLDSVEFPKTLKVIGASAFRGNYSLKSVKFNGPCFYIGDYAFCNCASLKEIRLPNGIPEIKAGTFDGCRQLRNLFIPKSVNRVNAMAFRNIPKLMVEAPEHLRYQLGIIPNLVVKYY